MLRKFCGGLLFALLVAISPAHAQSDTVVPLPSGCGTGNITNGQGYLTEATNGQLCVNASVSASISGFTPNGNFATLTATGSSASSALPSGTTIAFQNTGTTAVSCTLGIGSATASASQIIIQAASTVFVTPGSNTFGACIDQTGSASNVVVMAGGAGLGAGFGGGGGSSGGTSNITQTAGTNIDPTIAATGQLPIDTKTNSNLYTLLNSATPAGTNTIGSVGVLSYPLGTTPITASATGTISATTATLAANASLKTYLCSYSIRANATAATTVQNTITGVVTATMTHQMWVAPAASGIGVDEQIFSPCIPSSAINTAIAVASGAPGSGGLVSVTATGYQGP